MLENMADLISINSRQDMVLERFILPIVNNPLIPPLLRGNFREIKRQNPRSAARMSEKGVPS